MNLASKIILGFLIVVALVFWYLAMYVLDLRGWQELAHKRDIQLRRTKAENAFLSNSDDANARTALADPELAAGPPEGPGVQQLRHELQTRMIDRGRMWIGNAAPAANAPGSPLIFTVQPDPVQPTPLTIAPKTVLYIFEYPPFLGDATNNAPPGRYLGEFVVLDAPPS